MTGEAELLGVLCEPAIDEVGFAYTWGAQNGDQPNMIVDIISEVIEFLVSPP